MASLREICKYLDDLLRVKEFKDFTYDGLAVDAGVEEVKKVGFAVDSCLESFEKLADCDLIVVHHGLWWPNIDHVDALQRKRLQALLDNGTSLYVSHLPLDRHPQLGNNAQILRRLGLEISGDFGEVGWYSDLPQAVELDKLVEEVRTLTGGNVLVLPFGSKKISRLAVCSGNGGTEFLNLAHEIGAQLYLTGESSFNCFHPCRELGMNTIFAGHYATEVFGVQALMPVLEEAFGVETEFCPLDVNL